MSASSASIMVGSTPARTSARTPIHAIYFAADFGFNPIRSSIGVRLPLLEIGIVLFAASWIVGTQAGHSVHGSFLELRIAARLSSMT